MKNKILTFLTLYSSKDFIAIKGGKISFWIIVAATILLWNQKGILTALQFVGFIAFFLGITYVYILHKLDITAHQQEKIRPNFKQRKHQRVFLLMILTVLIVSLGTLFLYHFPYAFLFF